MWQDVGSAHVGLFFFFQNRSQGTRRSPGSTYTAASRLGSPGSWCRAAGPAEVRTPGKSPAAAACWRPRTRTSWPSTSAAGAPSAAATWCPGTASWCTCRGSEVRALINTTAHVFSLVFILHAVFQSFILFHTNSVFYLLVAFLSRSSLIPSLIR